MEIKDYNRVFFFLNQVSNLLVFFVFEIEPLENDDIAD